MGRLVERAHDAQIQFFLQKDGKKASMLVSDESLGPCTIWEGREGVTHPLQACASEAREPHIAKLLSWSGPSYI